MNQDTVRNRLKAVLNEHGIRVTFIAKKLGWNYEFMIKFKNGYGNYSKHRLQELSKFLNKYE